MSATRAIAAPGSDLAFPGRWGTAWRHPFAICAMALAAGAAVARFGATPAGLTMALFFAVLVMLSVIDLERRVLPNAIVLPAAALVLGAHLAFEPAHAAEWMLAALGAAGLLFVLFLINPAGMGMGDVKLALLLGVGLGAGVFPAFLIASLSVWPFAIWMVAVRGGGVRRTAIPFGPFLAFGALAAALLGSAGA